MNASTVPDEELIERIAQKDATAMTILYDKHAALLYGILLKIAPTAEEANDLLQEVCVQIWIKAAGFNRAKGSPLVWLCSIARNKAIDAQRRQTTRRTKKDAFSHLEQQRRPHVRREEDPWEKLMMVEDASVVRDAMADLSDQQREIITIAFFEGLTQKEIADKLSIPLGTVKSRMRQGMKRLASHISKATVSTS